MQRYKKMGKLQINFVLFCIKWLFLYLCSGFYGLTGKVKRVYQNIQMLYDTPSFSGF